MLLPGFPNPVRLTLSAEINPAGLPLAGIRCSLHATAEEAAADGRTIVRLRAGERLDRDFILRLAVARHDQIASSLVLTTDPGEGPRRARSASRSCRQTALAARGRVTSCWCWTGPAACTGGR